MGVYIEKKSYESTFSARVPRWFPPFATQLSLLSVKFTCFARFPQTAGLLLYARLGVLAFGLRRAERRYPGAPLSPEITGSPCVVLFHPSDGAAVRRHGVYLRTFAGMELGLLLHRLCRGGSLFLLRFRPGRGSGLQPGFHRWILPSKPVSRRSCSTRRRGPF